MLKKFETERRPTAQARIVELENGAQANKIIYIYIYNFVSRSAIFLLDYTRLCDGNRRHRERRSCFTVILPEFIIVGARTIIQWIGEPKKTDAGGIRTQFWPESNRN